MTQPITLTPAEALAASSGTLDEIVREMEPQPHRGISRFAPLFGVFKPMWTEPLPDDVAEHNVSLTCPLGLPGETRWCRERWADVNCEAGPALLYYADHDLRSWEQFSKTFGPNYGAGPSMDYKSYPGQYAMWWSDLLNGAEGHYWRQARHMPQWASRFTTTNKSVTIERRGGKWCWVAKVEITK